MANQPTPPADELAGGVERVVERQIAAGLDVITTEQPRVGFQTYVAQRLAGFGGVTERLPFTDFAPTRILPDLANRGISCPRFSRPVADASCAIRSDPARRECAMFDAARAKFATLRRAVHDGRVPRHRLHHAR